MPQFDAYRLADGEVVVDCQADLLSELDTRFVVPLLPEKEARSVMRRLNPTVALAGETYVVFPQQCATVLRTELTDYLGTLAEHDLTIGNALDMLISGF